MIQERNNQVDTLRAIAIILVVIGHTIQYVYVPENFNDNKLFSFIYSFHMPLFMFISGYLVYSNNRSINFQWILKKAKSLVIPYLLWFFIAWTIGGFRYNVLKKIASTLLYPSSGGYWFLWILFLNCFWIYIIFGLGSNLVSKTLLFVIIMFILRFVSILGFDLCYWYLPFMVMGVLVHHYYDFLNNNIPTYIGIAVVFSFLIMGFFWKRDDIVCPILYNWLSNTNLNMLAVIACKIYGLAVPVLGIASTIFIVQNFKMKKNTVLLFLGQHTVEIYLIHYYFLRPYTSLRLADSLISFSISIIAACAISVAVEKKPCLGKIVFGRGY